MTDGQPPAWIRKLEVVVLMRSFARAAGVTAPPLAGLSAAESLRVYREFTAACMELALERPPVDECLRKRLGEEARRLGAALRRLLFVRSDQAFAVARYFYRGIGIGLTGDVPGDLRFCPCLFSKRYTPQDCLLMSAFDEGFIGGLAGCEGGRLTFSCRLTEGATHCAARFDEGV